MYVYKIGFALFCLYALNLLLLSVYDIFLCYAIYKQTCLHAYILHFPKCKTFCFKYFNLTANSCIQQQQEQQQKQQLGYPQYENCCRTCCKKQIFLSKKEKNTSKIAKIKH